MASLTPYSSPWTGNLSSLRSTLANIPAQPRISLDQVSNDSITTICSKSYLHIYEADSDIASLLQITQVLVKLRELSTYIPQPNGMHTNVPAGIVILVELNPGRDDFGRVCDLVRNLSDEPGIPHLNGGVKSFGGIKVIKGINNRHVPNPNGTYHAKEHETEARKAVERVNKSIQRIFSSGAHSEKKIVWHHGPIVHFLNFWINNTTHDLRSALAAITVHSFLSISDSKIEASPIGKTNNISDLNRLEQFCRRLRVFTVFLDNGSQLITHSALSTYLYFHAYYIHTFLPSILSGTHYYNALDKLTTFCFRLRGACENSYESTVVKHVQSHLDCKKAKVWARECITNSAFTKSRCQAAANDGEIANAVNLADSPFAPFTTGNAAFSRLTSGPAASLIAGHYVCAPVSIAFPTCQIRFQSPSPFRLYLPKEQNIDVVTQRIQGVMIGVLQMAANKKGMPVIGNEAKEVWDDGSKACLWALEGCHGKLPNGVEAKVKFVENMLRQGTWSYVLGVSGGQHHTGWI